VAPLDVSLGTNITLNLTTNRTADLWWSYEQNGPYIVKQNQATSLVLEFNTVYMANATKYYFGCAKSDNYVECKRYSLHVIYEWGKFICLAFTGHYTSFFCCHMSISCCKSMCYCH